MLFGLYMVCSLPLCCLPFPPKVWNNLHVVAPQHVNHVVLSGTITATTSQFQIPRCQYLECRIPCAAHQHCHHIVHRCKDGKEYAVKTNLYCDCQYLEYSDIDVNIWSVEFHVQFTIIAMGPLLTYARLGKSVLSRLICIVAELVQGINVHGLCLQYAAGEQISLWMGQMPHRSPELPWIDGRRDWKIFSMASLMICLMLHWLRQLPNTPLTFR